jgi:hypothetical protein
VVFCLGADQSEVATIRKVRNVEFVVPTVFAVALAIVLSIGAIYLTEISSRLKPMTPSSAAAELLTCQTLTDDFRAFACCFPE